MTDFSLTRRGALQGSVVVVVGGVLGYLVARGSGAARTSQSAAAANAYGPAPAATGGHLLARLDQVPPGGGVILGRDKVVVTRTASGDVHAFSAVCTHQGCTVDQVAGGTIACPCHGSRFDADSGAVRAGPATRPLPPVTVSVRNGGIYRS